MAMHGAFLSLKYVDTAIGDHGCAQQQQEQTQPCCKLSPYWPTQNMINVTMILIGLCRLL